MRVLNGSDVDRLLDVDALIEALAPAMSDLSSGRVSIPPRSFAMVEDRGFLAAMPAYLETGRHLAAKLVLLFSENAAKGLPSHQALVAVFDPETGVPLAVMDGASITATRTAAGSALATKLCARPDAKTLAILGTGAQARSHARTVVRVRPITEVLIAGRTREHAEALAAEIGATAVDACEEAVRRADIVCSCTHASEVVVHADWVGPGTHVNAVGFTTAPELEPALFARAETVVVESRDAAIGEYPNGSVDITTAVKTGLLDRDRVVEVGELVDGKRAARTEEDQVTIYRSVGVAAQDATAAALVLSRAGERGIGVEVDF